MKLEKLLNGFEYEIIGNKDVDITTLVYDSRKVEEGSLFVCMVGAAFNAHDFIDQVIEKGAHAIVISQDVPLKEGMTYIRVKDTRIALALLSCAYFDYPSKELKVVGITGTKGKTSSSLMIKSILEHAGKKVGIIGTNGTFIGDIHEPTANTTPESYELQRIMRKMVEHDCEYCVMEVSSQALKMNRVAGIEFDYGVFTNISPDHIGPNEHKDFAEYMACKKHLFDFCHVGLFNKDDEHFEEFTKDVPCKVLTYSIEKDSDLKAEHIELYNENGELGITFDTKGLINAPFKASMPGKFNAYNALVAIMICYLIDVPTKDIQNTLPQVHVLGRGQVMHVSPDYSVLIDYAHNGVSFESIISTVEQYNPNKLIVVYGSGGKRSKTRRYESGEVVAKHGGYSILTADNPRGEKIVDICNDIVVGIDKYHGEYSIIPDRKEAIYHALDMASKGDVVLLLGKGHETYMIGEDEVTRHFSETEVLEEYKKERGLNA